MTYTVEVIDENTFGGHLVIKNEDNQIAAQVFLRMQQGISIRPIDLPFQRLLGVDYHKIEANKGELRLHADFTLTQLGEVIERLTQIHDALIIHLAHTAESKED